MAIDDLLDEHEQGERVREWLRKNGAGIIGGVALGIAMIVGFYTWKNHRQQQAHQAHEHYVAITQEIDNNALDEASNDFSSLTVDHSDIYTAMIGLRLAKAQVEGDKLDEAITTLRKVRSEALVTMIVDARMARLLIDNGQAEEALKTLESATDSLSLEVRGDALVALQRRDAAREAYDAALAAMDDAAPQRRLVEMKLMDVGGTVSTPVEPAV